MQKIFIHIGARQGSKSVKNKNIKMLASKPLIAWSILQGLRLKKKLLKKKVKIVVSSDSKKILNISKKYKADFLIKRPKKISDASSAKFLVWKHSILEIKKKYGFTNQDIFLDLDCTCPLRKFNDIEKMINIFEKKKKEKKEFDGIITITEAKKNPYFNLIELNNKQQLKVSKKIKEIPVRRQDAPKVFEHVASIYILKPSFILKKKSLMRGKLYGFEVEQSTSIDIDSNFDFKLVTILKKSGLYKK
jgi:CMP-N,N'-diacetyllegionaminic acid synthase